MLELLKTIGIIIFLAIIGSVLLFFIFAGLLGRELDKKDEE